MYKDLTEASWQHVTRFLIATVTNARHQVLALETPADSVIDTFRFTPVALEFIISVTLMPDELFRPLLHDLGSVDWSDGHLEVVFGVSRSLICRQWRRQKEVRFHTPLFLVFPLGAFRRHNRWVSNRTWLVLLLEPTNQRRVLTRQWCNGCASWTYTMNPMIQRGRRTKI